MNWVVQAEQLGTAHAVQQAAPFFKDDENIVILYGDAPLVTKETLEKLIAAKPDNGIALLTVNLDNPTGYGRIIRENGNVVAIVEQKDANAEQLKIQEVNTGVLVADGAHFKNWLSRVKNNNAQGEFLFNGCDWFSKSRWLSGYCRYKPPNLWRWKVPITVYNLLH